MTAPARRASTWAEHLRESSPLFRNGASSSGKASRAALPRALPWLLVVTLAGFVVFQQRGGSHAGFGVDTLTANRQLSASGGKIFVSYSYFEKDDIQRDNFEFFLLAAMGVGATTGQDAEADYFVILNGEHCSPCQGPHGLFSVLGPEREASTEGVAWVRSGEAVTLIKRTENEGMDFAAHNTSMTYAMDALGSFWGAYAYYVFLNSSVKGPFVPKYYPAHWAVPYTSLIRGDVKAVGSSLVCLPPVDAGGPGPKMESWAFAIDEVGLRIVLEAGVFHTRACKLCNDGVVVMGEYGLTTALFAAGFSVDTLMARYASGIKWRDTENWNCNDQVHPSRHGTYDGISMHPFETVFLKASWHVGEPFADKYAEWRSAILRGESSTAGVFDEGMYTYAIQPHAQDKHAFIERAYQVGPRVPH